VSNVDACPQAEKIDRMYNDLRVLKVVVKGPPEQPGGLVRDVFLLKTFMLVALWFVCAGATATVGDFRHSTCQFDRDRRMIYYTIKYPGGRAGIGGHHRAFAGRSEQCIGLRHVCRTGMVKRVMQPVRSMRPDTRAIENALAEMRAAIDKAVAEREMSEGGAK
jgi:hypothetical protein